MKLAKNHLRTPSLVTAYTALQALFTHSFTVAPVAVEKRPDASYSFSIAGFGHGIVGVESNAEVLTICIKQFTSHEAGIAYAEYYEGRHGNRELMTLLRPLLESKILPVLVAVL